MKSNVSAIEHIIVKLEDLNSRHISSEIKKNQFGGEKCARIDFEVDGQKWPWLFISFCRLDGDYGSKRENGN